MTTEKPSEPCMHSYHRLGGIDDCPVCNPDGAFHKAESSGEVFDEKACRKYVVDHLGVGVEDEAEFTNGARWQHERTWKAAQGEIDRIKNEFNKPWYDVALRNATSAAELHHKDVKELESQRAEELVKVLEFYASEYSYDREGVCSHEEKTSDDKMDYWVDYGFTAREALKKWRDDMDAGGDYGKILP